MDSSEQKAQELLDLLLKFIKEIHPHFPKHSILMNDDFEKELGLDSLSRVELLSRVQEHYHINLCEEELYEIQNAKALFQTILGAKEALPADLFQGISAQDVDESSSLPYEAKTLIDVLHWHLQRHPDRIHIQMYEDDASGESISYQQLYNEALKVAFSLQKLGLQPSGAVAIMLPSSVEYFYSFYGILLAGGIPVPIYPPARASQLEEHVKRHTHILNNCESSILITIPEAKLVAKLLQSYAPELQHIITPKQLLDSQETHCSLPQIKEDDIAFIQYTSGSTGDPKGVVLSHANLLANIRAMGEAVEASSKDVFVSWLPLYHDMGLIGSWLGSIYHASLFVVMSPLSFLSKPERWLWAIHQYKGTLSASPNFAYEYCLHRLKERDLKGLDLSSWRLAFNGAEAVSPITMKKFCEHFKAYGFDPISMTPVYGLAESSVGLVFPPLNRGPLVDHIQRDLFMKKKIAEPSSDKSGLEFVSSGLALKGHQIRIVDEFNQELPSRHEGALQFQGPSSTKGYFKNQKKTDELIHKEWLNTGDQAYIAEGELYITGRVKDIIIRAGRNIYPDQLEKAIGLIEGIRKGCVAIFGENQEHSGTERLIILAECKESDTQVREELISKISNLSGELLGSVADEVVLAEVGAILKTSSGKIRRSATKELYASHRGKAQSQNLFLQLSRLFIKSIFPNIKRSSRYIQAKLFSFYHWFIFSIFASLAWFSLIICSKSSAQGIAKFYLRAISKLIFIPIHTYGLENLNKNQKSVYVVNHTSYLDAFILFLSLPFDLCFIAKAELKEHFHTRIPLEKLGVHFVQRYEMSQSIQDVQTLLEDDEQGPSFVIFPEGTFSSIPGLKDFHMGAFILALDKELALVPISISGTRFILRDDSSIIKKGEIEIHISKPISLEEEHEDLSKWEKALYLSKKSREFILQYSNEPDLQN